MTATRDRFMFTSSCHAYAIADHVTSTGLNQKWDPFEILAKDWLDTTARKGDPINKGTAVKSK